MLDIETLEKYDSQKMYKIYDDWSELARKSYNENNNKLTFDGVDHIVFAGMGGSGALADIFAAILSKMDVHVRTVKGYHLPKTVDSNTLVITTSISGDTEETLSVLHSAFNQDCKIAAFSSGGKMEEYCIKNKITYNKIQKIHSPRASFANFLYYMLKSLETVLPISKEDIQESIEKLEENKKKINSQNITENNPALNIANWIKGIPLIYYPWGLQSAAIRFKNSLQENAKMHAITEDVIEACHNGIVSWEKNTNVQPILIEGYDDFYKTKERWDVLKKYFEKNQIEYYEIKSSSGSILSKIINLIYILDYASIYKAVLNKVDPSPVKSIDYIKNNL